MRRQTLPQEILRGPQGGRKMLFSWLTPQLTKAKVNTIIFEQGMRADAVFYIQRGRVRISVLSPQGKEAVIAVLSRGSFFGEDCLADRNARLTTAVTMAESILLRLNRDLMIRALHKEPVFARRFMGFLLDRNMEIWFDLVDQLFNSSEKRLAQTLLLLAGYGRENRLSTIPRISQRALAARIGTTRSHISAVLKKFRSLGYIEGSRDMKVNDSLLRILTDD